MSHPVSILLPVRTASFPDLARYVAQVADTFEKHVERPTLDACARALVHATADGSDATKV